MKQWFGRLILVAALSTPALACGGSDSEGGDGDGDTAGDGDGDTAGDGDGDTAGDGDGDGTVAGDCESAPDPSPNTIPETDVTDAYPAPAGGTIADGLYYLSSYQIYAPGTADDHVRARLFLIDGNEITMVNVDDGGVPTIMGGTYATSGTSLTASFTCPSALELTIEYTATDSELWIFDTEEPNLQVYEKQ